MNKEKNATISTELFEILIKILNSVDLKVTNSGNSKLEFQMSSSETKPAVVIFTFQGKKKDSAVLLCLFSSGTVKSWGKSTLLLSSGTP